MASLAHALVADAQLHTVRLDNAKWDCPLGRGAWPSAFETSFSWMGCNTADFKDSRSRVVFTGHELDMVFGGVDIACLGAGGMLGGVFEVFGGGRGDVGGV